MAKDSAKRTALFQMGFRVVSLAGGQVSERSEVSRTALALAKMLGYKYQPRGRDHGRQMERLEWTVFRDQASIFSGSVNVRSRNLHPKVLVGGLKFRDA